MTPAGIGAQCRTCGAKLPDELKACPRCLFSKGSNDDLILLGGYLELEDEIGRGGMGAVYRAQDRRLQRTVAVKLLHPDLARDEAVRARFAREARALAGLQHPHIVHVYDVGEDEGEPYIVFEHVAGGTLANLVPCEARRALELAHAIADALATAHGRGIVHRDVKPGNVLLDTAGRPKVADFGLARPMKPGSGWTVTASELAVGTPVYMSPEALAGGTPDPRSDIYALGVLLHELATGELPRGAFEPAPDPIGPLVRRALAPDPARRFQTAEAFRDEIAKALETVRRLARAGTTALPVTPLSSTSSGGAFSPGGVALASTPTRPIPVASPPAPAAPTPATPTPATAPIPTTTPPESSPVPPTTPAKAASPVSDGLPADEEMWRSAVALVLVMATGAFWFDLIASVQPKFLAAGESLPLVVLDAQPLPDGRLFSRARFETIPTVVCVAAWTGALIAVALLRAHWRHARLDVTAPERAVPGGRRTLPWGVVSILVYAGHKISQASAVAAFARVAPYVPILGAGLEVGSFYVFWTAVLEAARTRRSLTREPVLFFGLFLTIIPPVVDLLLFIANAASP